MNYISLMRFEVYALCVIVLLLLVKIFSEKLNVSVILGLINFSLVAMLAAGFIGHPHGSAFGGMFANDGTLMLEKSIITLATLLISLQAGNWLKDHDNYAEFYLLLFSVLTGMYFMLSSGNFLMFYLGLEMATIPLAALAAFDFNRIRSAEGAVKMILSSAFSSAILLFGLSILYGVAGSLDFIAVREMYSSSVLEIFALTFILVGFAFKISIVP
ncbi:MAG TPA: proton-conducting transporter membrane subunit, partial [Bacteroidia bacterium]